MTHWKKYQNPNFIGSWALEEGERMQVTIKEAVQEEVHNPDPKGSKTKECLVLHFKEKNVKPMILNVTNSKKVSSLVGSPYIEDWPGNRIGLYVDEKVKAFGKTTRGLRICAASQAKKELKPGTDVYKKAVAKLEAGKTTIEKIKKYYEVPDGFPQQR